VPKLSAAFAALAASAALAAVLLFACERSGPAPVAWDRTRCAQCGMLVSDPAFAAQLHNAEGVRHFDDPGCLLAALAALQAGDADRAAQIWLHHHQQPRWLAGAEAAFVPTPHSPMGYRLGAVAAGEAPGAISLEEAQRRAAHFDRKRRPQREGAAPHHGPPQRGDTQREDSQRESAAHEAAP